VCSTGSSERQEYLVVYDYGMGGRWAIVDAPNAETITLEYPELTVVDDRPPWMTDNYYRDLRARELHTIEAEPVGLLKILRDHRPQPPENLSPS
jgi:hypothetical protein